MQSISKAIAAAAGGAVAGGATSAVVLPEGSPWYAYLILAGITTVVPLVFTYFAPANKPAA